MRGRLTLWMAVVVLVAACTGDTEGEPADGEWLAAGISTVQTADGFELTLEVEDLELEPGKASRARLTITNLGDRTLYTSFLGNRIEEPAAFVKVEDSSGASVVKYVGEWFENWLLSYEAVQVEKPVEDRFYFHCTFDGVIHNRADVRMGRDDFPPGTQQALEFQICVDYWQPTPDRDLTVVGRVGYTLERGWTDDGLSNSVVARLPVRYTGQLAGE